MSIRSWAASSQACWSFHAVDYNNYFAFSCSLSWRLVGIAVPWFCLALSFIKLSPLFKVRCLTLNITHNFPALKMSVGWTTNLAGLRAMALWNPKVYSNCSINLFGHSPSKEVGAKSCHKCVDLNSICNSQMNNHRKELFEDKLCSLDQTTIIRIYVLETNTFAWKSINAQFSLLSFQFPCSYLISISHWFTSNLALDSVFMASQVEIIKSPLFIVHCLWSPLKFSYIISFKIFISSFITLILLVYLARFYLSLARGRLKYPDCFLHSFLD